MDQKCGTCGSVMSLTGDSRLINRGGGEPDYLLMSYVCTNEDCPNREQPTEVHPDAG